MAAEKLIRMTKRLSLDVERTCDNLRKCSYTSAPAGLFPEPADPTMRSIFAIFVSLAENQYFGSTAEAESISSPRNPFQSEKNLVFQVESLRDPDFP